MVEIVSLLPPENTVPYEYAISEAVAAWYKIPVERLDTLNDPRTCPPDRLPSLAAEFGVPLWPARWDLNRQRAFTLQWISLSRRRGQRRTFEALLKAVDAELVDWVVPPAICAPRASRTPEQRAAYRAHFPEIRVFAYAKQAVRKGLLVPGRPWGGRHRAPQASTTAERRANRAVLIRSGQETPLTIRFMSGNASGAFAGGYYEAVLPDSKPRLIPGRPWFGSKRVPLASTAASRTFRYAPGDAAPDLLPPRLVPFSIKPDRVREPHKRPRLLVPGRPWGGARSVTRPSVASQYVYDSIRLYDPDLAVTTITGKPGGWILGRSQLGTDRFRIDCIVDATYRAPGRRFMLGKPLRGVAHGHDNSRTKEICATLRAAKLGRDKVMLKTGLYRTIEPSDNIIPDGTFLPGQTIRTR